jgi:uracil-DNA glycosylase family 4
MTFSIKDSFANCLQCELLEAPSCILETNCKDDLSKVDVIFIAENPGKDECRGNPPRPLIGKAGQMFRKYFKKYGIDKLNYLLTNTVLCLTLTPDGKTGNPTDEVIDRCKVNAEELIKICDPKLVVLMGSSPMKAFNIAKSGITELHGKFYNIKNTEYFVMVHPSFVNRRMTVWEPKFEEAMATLSGHLRGEEIEIHTKKSVKNIGKGIHRYKIPDKFYTDEYRLIDIQFLNTKRKVLYIFRNRNNEKIYHTENDDYFCYQTPDGVDAHKLVPYNQLNQIVVPYREKIALDPNITYEGDMRISAKHAIDYYHFNQEDCKLPYSNIMFFDIEVDTGKDRVFPKPDEAKYPINMVTAIFNGKRVCFVVDNKTEPITEKPGTELRIFRQERPLVQAFFEFVKECEPDFMAGWNAIGFDTYYIFNRLPKIKMVQTSVNRFGEFYVDGPKYVAHYPGTIIVDQDFFYKTFTFTKMENYKLGFIAQHELGVSKIQLPLPFNEMYWKMLNKTIEYNIRDTELLEKLENKLKHINLMNELRTVCTTSFDACTSSGQIDSLMVNYLKNKGLASKNSDPHIRKEDYPGAYVYEPIPDVYENITDFDFASLYPSIIITYNIGPNSFIMKFKDPQMGYDLAYQPHKLPDTFKMIIDPTFSKKEVLCNRDELLKKLEETKWIHTINGCFFKQHEDEKSVFSEVLEMLLGSRKQYKNKMFDAIQEKDEDMKEYFYTRQLVYKVLANTLYGVVANKVFRFFDVGLAAAVTVSGQEALKTSIIEGDAYMRHLDSGKPYVQPKTLTKVEMYADPDTQPDLYRLPDRSHEYIVTGDTDSIFCCFGNFKGDKSVKNIHAWCEEIQDFLNDIKMKNLVKMHNVDPQYNRLALKNELVISRGIFFAKKRYAIRVINNEGKDVDQINYMGLEIKRSDYPSKSKEFLKELSELILKSDVVSLSKIMEFVKMKEKEFVRAITEGEKSIARPVSFGKEINAYKTLPQAVKAMLGWNEIMYDIHKPGAKAYLYRISGLDQMKAPADVLERYEKYIGSGNKLDAIAIPDEEERLPDYFIPDLRASLKFSFIDRYELMLKPLMEAKLKMEVMTI